MQKYYEFCDLSDFSGHRYYVDKEKIKQYNQ